MAACLVSFAARTRALAGHGLEEGASTRMLVQAARLVAGGIALRAASRVAIVTPLTDDADSTEALEALLAAELPP